MKKTLLIIAAIFIANNIFSQNYHSNMSFGETIFLETYNIDYDISKSKNCKTISYPENYNQFSLIESSKTFVTGIKKFKIKRDKIKYIYIVEYWEKLDSNGDGKKDIFHDFIILAEYKNQKLIEIDNIQVEKLLDINRYEAASEIF